MKEGKKGYTKLSVWVPSKVHMEAKLKSILTYKSLTDYVVEAIEEKNKKEERDE